MASAAAHRSIWAEHRPPRFSKAAATGEMILEFCSPAISGSLTLAAIGKLLFWARW
jgi:hypothetical protein